VHTRIYSEVYSRAPSEAKPMMPLGLGYEEDFAALSLSGTGAPATPMSTGVFCSFECSGRQANTEANSIWSSPVSQTVAFHLLDVLVRPEYCSEDNQEPPRFVADTDKNCDAHRRALLARIDEFAKRAPDWDGDGGVAPNEEAVMDAKAFLNSLDSGIVSCAATLSPGDGEVLFQWRKDDAFIEVNFYGDGTISWYAKDADGNLRYADSPFKRERACEIDQELVKALKSIV
jgi:hypothetical protein